MLGNLNRGVVPPAVRERRLKGYQNALRFHRMYASGWRPCAWPAAMPENRQSWDWHCNMSLGFLRKRDSHPCRSYNRHQMAAETLKVSRQGWNCRQGKLAESDHR